MVRGKFAQLSKRVKMLWTDCSWKAEVDKVDIDKLKTVPANLCKLRNVADSVFKKAVYDK